MLACLAGLLASVATTNWIVNPYGVWRTTLVPRAYRLTDAGADELGERLSTPYRLRAEQPSTLLVGSSRVLKGMLVEQSGQSEFFNAGLSGATLVELGSVLRLANSNPRLRRVIWGVEFYAFDERYIPYDPPTRSRLEADDRRALTLRIKETLFNMQAFRDSRRVLARAVRRQKPDSLEDPVPWPEELIKERLSHVGQEGLPQTNDATVTRQLQNWIVSYVDYRPSPTRFALFQEMLTDLRRAGLEVILFVPPLSDCELETIDQAGVWDTFQHWKRELLGAAPYWDFSGYGKLHLAPELFTDVTHFKPAVGQVILRRVLGMSCARCGERAQTIWDAGVWVDATTVDAYLAHQESARTAIRPQNTRCAKTVERMLIVPASSSSRAP
jgi:hypothetical protein